MDRSPRRPPSTGGPPVGFSIVEERWVDLDRETIPSEEESGKDPPVNSHWMRRPSDRATEHSRRSLGIKK
jgi:hypothetical protein